MRGLRLRTETPALAGVGPELPIFSMCVVTY